MCVCVCVIVSGASIPVDCTTTVLAHKKALALIIRECNDINLMLVCALIAY